MPAFLTHWRILIRSAEQLSSQAPRANPLAIARGGSLAFPDVRASEPGATIPSLCYLGAIGPDIPYLAGSLVRASVLGPRYTGAVLGRSPWADLLHYNRSGDFLVEFMRLAARAQAPELQQRALAYALGYVTHIAGDIVVHPLVNSFAGAYHQQTAPGTFFGLGLHFWVETCQDARTAQRFFGRDLAQSGRQWSAYLHSALREFTTTCEGESLLTLLQATAQQVYGLSDDSARMFGAEYLAGLDGMLRYVSGASYFHLLYTALRLTPRLEERFSDYAAGSDPRTRRFDFTHDRVVGLAERVAARLCQLTGDYFGSLLQSGSPETQERHYQRLRADLKNWDLDTGYYMESVPATADRAPRLAFRHSWPHFAALNAGARVG